MKAGNLLPLSDIFHYIPPLLHIIMGLGNNLFNELKKQVVKLDEAESNMKTILSQDGDGASAARPGTNGASAARPGTNGAPVARPGTKEREERDEELKNLYVDKEELEDKDSNENLAKMVLINDLERVLLLKEGKMQEAEVVAKKKL